MINQKNYDLVGRAVAQSALPTEQVQLMKAHQENITLLNSLCRVTPGMELLPMEFLFRLFDEPCFPRGELVAVTGKAKSGKTFVLSIIMSLCVVRELLSFRRETAQPLRVLWYDTEQSMHSTLDILKNRIMPLCRKAAGEGTVFPEDMFDIFNVREVDRHDRRALLSSAISEYHPDLAVIDGIRDLVDDINDGIAAQDLMEQLMRTAQREKCCVVCVLHQNKASESRDPRGWLGTELLNKAFDVFATEKLMPQRIFKFEQLYTRKYDIEQALWFGVGDDGLPEIAGEPPVAAMPGSDAMTEERPTLNDAYVIHHADGNWEMDVVKLFTDVLKGRDSLTGAALRYQVKLLGSIATNRLYNNLLDKAMRMGLMERWKDSACRVCYRLKPQYSDGKTRPAAQQQDMFRESDDTAPF